MADEVGGDEVILAVLEDALVFTFSSLLDDRLDLIVSGSLLGADNEVDNGDIESGDTEGESTVDKRLDEDKYQTKVISYVSLPLSEGITLPTALAAPVEEGMMLLLTLRPPRQSLPEGPSTVFWVAVVAWTVVINPSTIPKLSWITLAKGARQLVVQEALEI